MNILILNGSPKGEKSISLFYAKYLIKKFPNIKFEIVNISSKIRIIENNNDKFNEIVTKITKADGLIWALPVYVLSVPGQVMRFYELVRNRCEPDVFQGKYVSSIITSMHYFDHNAMLYLQAQTEDLNGYFVEGFSAEMFDIKQPKIRKNLINYANMFFSYIDEKKPVIKRFYNFEKNKINDVLFYDPNMDCLLPVKHNSNIVLISNNDVFDNNVNQMIGVFKKIMGDSVEHIRIENINLKGGCLGCLQCSQEGICVYNDDYEKYKTIIKNADAVIYALKINHHSFGSSFKMFADRGFSNGHRVKKNFFTGFLISGPLYYENHVQNIIDGINYGGKSAFDGNVVCDYKVNSDELTKLIEVFCQNLIRSIDLGYNKPTNFYGVAAHKIFRDLVFATSSLQRADDYYYKKNNLYDFPTWDYKTRLLNLFVKIITLPKGMRKSFNKKINTMMIKDFEKIIES